VLVFFQVKVIRKSAQLRGLGQDLLGDNGHRITCSVENKQTNASKTI